MSAALDRALLAISIQDEVDEIPFDLSDPPEYRSSARNGLSLIGRLLNPDHQKMSSLILDMPRKWGKVGKCRGVALTEERFQFIFDTEHDLIDTLDKDVHTYNEWALAVERWVEDPHDDYLQFVYPWVRLRHIPVNHYTRESITALGELADKVKVVEFDPSIPYNQGYVRVQIQLNVANPLRRTRLVNLPKGGQATILYEYEELQKRCFSCPRRVRAVKDASDARVLKVQEKRNLQAPVIQKDDPLFGIVKEHQVGVNPFTGRPKIVAEVLEEMRMYLLSANGPERIIKEARVLSSLADVGENILAQKAFLLNESPPVFSRDVNKGKGPVFDYGFNDYVMNPFDNSAQPPKLMDSAIQVGTAFARLSYPEFICSKGLVASIGNVWQFRDVPTVNRPGTSDADPSGKSQFPSRGRRRPSKNCRKPNSRNPAVDSVAVSFKVGAVVGSIPKRKAADEASHSSKVSKRNQAKVVPNEGLPKC